MALLDKLSLPSGVAEVCVCCRRNEGYTSAGDGALIALPGSVFEGDAFVWLEAQGFVTDGNICDDCIRKKIENDEIELYYNDLQGPIPGLSEGANRAAYELGRRRMTTVIRSLSLSHAVVEPHVDQLFPVAGAQIATEDYDVRDILITALGLEPEGCDPESWGRLDALLSIALVGMRSYTV